jgi:sugar phosphate isomerase/epimerase
MRPVRVGLDEWSIRHVDMPAVEKLSLVERLGFQGIQFLNASRVSAALDHGEIRELAGEAERRGIYVEMGIPGLNPLRPSPDLLRVGDGDVLAGLEAFLRAAAVTGCTAIRTFVGPPCDRFAGPPARWKGQLQAATGFAVALAPLARELGVRLAFETHADATTRELLQLIGEVGEDVAGICLDTGNLPVTLEDPLAAVKRVAPYVACTHLKDCVVFPTDHGVGVQSRPLGRGMLPLRQILRAICESTSLAQLTVEDHDGIFEAPLPSDADAASLSGAERDELVALIVAGHECRWRCEVGDLVWPHLSDAVPWEEQAEDRLRISASFAKAAVGRLAA